MEPPHAVMSAMSSAIVEKLAGGLETIWCVYPNCRSSASVDLFNVHLARCRRNWRGPMTVCSYNCVHVIPAPEERYHELTCPDRWSIAQLSKCKEKLQEVSKSTIGQENDGAKKQGFESFGVDNNRTQATYFCRGGGRYSKWRNVGPRLQNRSTKQIESDPCESATAAATLGRGQRSLKWQRSTVTGIRGGRRGLSFANQRNFEGKMPSIGSAFVDDLSAPSARGFSPWASPKTQSSSLIDAVRWNSTSRARWSASSVVGSQQQQAIK